MQEIAILITQNDQKQERLIAENVIRFKDELNSIRSLMYNSIKDIKHEISKHHETSRTSSADESHIKIRSLLA